MRALPARSQFYIGAIWASAFLALLIALFLTITDLKAAVAAPDSFLPLLLTALIFAAMLAVADFTAVHLDNGRIVSIAVALLIAGLTATKLHAGFLLLMIVCGTLSPAIAYAVPWWRFVTIIAVRWLAVALAAGIAFLTWQIGQPIVMMSAAAPSGEHVFTLYYTTWFALAGLFLTGALFYGLIQVAEIDLAAFGANQSWRTWWQGRQDDLIWHTFLLAPLGGLLATLWALHPILFVLGVVPLAIVQYAFRSQVALSQSQDELNRRSTEMQHLAAEYSALNSKLERLQSLAITLIATRDVQTMLETLCQRLAALLGASSGWVVLHDEQQMPHMVAWQDLPVQPQGNGPYPVPVPQSYEQILQSRRVVVLAEDQRTMTLAPLPVLCENWFWRALIVIPLTIDEHSAQPAQLLGAICLTFAQVRGLDQNEQRILTAFARQAALSIENARLFTQVQDSQAELIQSSKLAAVGTFAAGIAHEFNNLLAGMLGYAQLGLTIKAAEQKNESLQIVVDACKRGKSITGSLLTFARRQEPRREPGDIRGVIEDTLTLMEIDLRKCHIDVERRIEPVPLTVCDLGQIAQVVLNLLTNARDAMKPDGGDLVVTLGHTPRSIIFSVADTGCGIPDAIRDKIFEPFVTTKGALGGSQTPGTGLGLSVSYGIIQEHAGSITIDSTPGQGTCVTVSIPLVEAAAPAVANVPVSSNGQLAPLRILVVDDDPTIGDAFTRLLQHTNHSVDSVQSGAMALQRFREEPFDIVLTDLSMPGMGGVELVHELHTLAPDVPVFIATGQSDQAQIEQGLAAGAAGVLHKPFEIQEFLDLVVAARR